MTQVVVYLLRPDGTWCDAARSVPFDPADFRGFRVEATEYVPPTPPRPALRLHDPAKFDGNTPLVSTAAGRQAPPPPGSQG